MFEIKQLHHRIAASGGILSCPANIGAAVELSGRAGPSVADD
jgi:hypothetical protein